MSTTTPEILNQYDHDIFTPTETAKLLRVGRNKMYDLINNGMIRCVKFDRKILIPRTYLQEFIANNTVMCYNDSRMKTNPSCCGKGVNQ